MSFFSRVAAISDAGDFSGSGFDPSHTDSMTSPVTRLASPRAIVSTSGNSGIVSQSMTQSGWARLLRENDPESRLGLPIAHSEKMNWLFIAHLSGAGYHFQYASPRFSLQFKV
jgi:hypothetical protein